MWGVLGLEACKAKCATDANCHGVSRHVETGKCYTETADPDQGDAPGNEFTVMATGSRVACSYCHRAFYIPRLLQTMPCPGLASLKANGLL